MSENLNPLDQFLEAEESGDPFEEFTEPTSVAQTEPKPQASEAPAVPEIAPASEPQKTEPPVEDKEPALEAKNATAAEQPELTDDAPDPFAAALAEAKAQSESRLTAELAEKPAVFAYGKVKDSIADKDCTFEDLRLKYEGDFPELSESKKVEWSVTYGKEIKTITNPGSDKVYAIKAEIEGSKRFLDAIKKAKTDADKNPECTVKPRIKAQSKGKILAIPSYKDFCDTEEEARKSEKTIVLLPSSDGRIYQLRKTPVGDFVAPVKHLNEFPVMKPGFRMRLPKIPMHILMFVWDFFACLSDNCELEALVHILYDTKRKKYTVRVPKQELTHISVNSVLEEDYPEHMIHVMDIHSHNTMPAKFSAIDDNDEKATRLYAVMGRIDKVLPDITVRASCAGEFIYIDPADVFDTRLKSFPHPDIWDKQIEATQGVDIFRWKKPSKPLLLEAGESV